MQKTNILTFIDIQMVKVARLSALLNNHDMIPGYLIIVSCKHISFIT